MYDLVGFGAKLPSSDDPDVTAAIAAVTASDVTLVASPEVFLRPALVELGMSCPVGGLPARLRARRPIPERTVA
ncbi:hypothetical protein ACXR2U_15995 [Jatrophihabitans sp. YIM 134969]